MNFIYVGRAFDLNIGIGKTVSAVGDTISSWIENPNRKIFSNIKLEGVDYVEFTPYNIDEVLETEYALVIFDELHSIVHKKHVISESCTKHEVKGLCYKLSEFFRQVRKRKIDTRSTCQTLDDAQFQMRQLMNAQVLCEKFHIEGNRLVKCKVTLEHGDECPLDHRHIIKQVIYPMSLTTEPRYFDPEPYYQYYNSYEIVKGWV